MLNRRNFWISCLVAIFGIASAARAQHFTHSTRLVSLSPVVSVPQGNCGPVDLTEGTSDTVTSGNSVSCNNGVGHTDNSYWRAFTLADFGILGNLNVCDVRIGVESAVSGSGTGQPMTVNLYTSDQAFPTGFPGSLTLIGTADVNVTDQALTLLDIPVTGTAPAGSQLVVEIFTPDGEAAGNLFFIGSNAAAETNPSYVSAAACATPAPVTTGSIGFPDMHIVMHVFGTEVLTADPASLTVDPLLTIGILNNGVLEMNEAPVVVAPGWTNSSLADYTLTGVASNFTGPGDGAGVTYTLSDSAANYGNILAGTTANCLAATGDCYTVDIAGVRTDQPVHMDATLDEDVTPVPSVAFGQPSLILKTWTLHVGESFADVSNDLALDPYYPSIETVFHNGVTAGCGDGTVFCPTDPTTRAQMAVFLLKSSQGSGYTPPACASIFTDVPCPATVGFPFSDWIEDLYGRGITGGCNAVPLMYCPDADVTRAQMAVFLLKASQGSGYTPPACASIFTDVPCPATPEFPFSDYIEDLYGRGITSGCGVSPLMYCPDNNALRQEMAVFLTKTFSLVLYGP